MQGTAKRAGALLVAAALTGAPGAGAAEHANVPGNSEATTSLVASSTVPGVAAHFAADTGPAKRLELRHVSPWVDMVVVQPGERFALEGAEAGGAHSAVTWRARGGKLAYGDRFAVWTAPLEAGAYSLKGAGLLAGERVERTLTMLVTVPGTRVSGGSLNGYPIGTYPRGFSHKSTWTASRSNRQDAYAVPPGFIELNATTADIPLSRHYRLKDFQGKDAAVSGRKYMFVDERLVEKLERLIDALSAQTGYERKIPLMSAFRSPYLNKAIGNTTSLSRHTYGDAADMIVQDFNRDGRADAKDAHILFAAVARLDHETNLTGGAAIYPPNSAHGYFVHTDARGSIARW